MKKLAYSILFVLCSLATFAQPGSGKGMREMPMDAELSGKIIDAQVETPVEYASVALYNLKNDSLITGTITDADGQFRLTELPYGLFRIEIKFIGYNTKVSEEFKLNPKKKQLDLGDIKIEQAFEQLEEVEIVAERKHIDYKIDRKVINVAQDVASANGSAVDVLENTPSVETDIDGNVSLRGSTNFTVLVDGRPTVLAGTDALQQIPAANIETIELITNPSVKYDPDGIAGIINIKLKKNKSGGISGLVNLSAGNDGYSTNVLMNYKTEKVNLFGGFEIQNKNMDGVRLMDQEWDLAEGMQYTYLRGDRGHSNKGYELKFGSDFYLNDKNTLTIGLSFGERGMNRNADFTSNVIEPDASQYYYDSESDFEVTHKYYMLTADYTKKFENLGHELSFSTQLITSNRNSDEDLLSEYFYPEMPILYTGSKSLEEGAENEFRLKVDYTLPISKISKFETGIQTRIDGSDSDYKAKNFNTNTNLWEDDVEAFNEFNLTYNIHAAYVSFSSMFAGFEYLAGLRGEYTDRVMELPASNKKYVVDRYDLFPSLHISRQLFGGQQIQLSYSRRVNRPQEFYLNPNPRWVNDYTMRVGNPEILPEFVDSYELNYQKTFKIATFTVEAYHRQTNNLINRIQTEGSQGDDNIIVFTVANIDHDYSTGVELSMNLNPVNWFMLNASANFFKYEIEGSIQESDVNQTTNTWNTQLNSTFKLPFGTRLQVSGSYTAPSITAQGDRDDFFVVNTGVKHDFFNNKLSLSLQVRDVLQTMNHSFTTQGNNLYTYNEFSRNSSVFTFGASFKINNYKQKNDESLKIDFDSDM